MMQNNNEDEHKNTIMKNQKYNQLSFFNIALKKNSQIIHLEAQKCFPDQTELAKKCVTYIETELKKNNYQLLKNWDKKSKIKTYLKVIAYKLSKQYSDSYLNNRQITPLCIQKKGQLCSEVFDKLCYQRHLPENKMEPFILNHYQLIEHVSNVDTAVEIIHTEYCKQLYARHITIIDKKIKKKFPTDENSAHEAWHYIDRKISENNYERIKKWKPIEYDFADFLNIVVKRLIVDFINNNIKSRQIPPLIKKKGPLWVEVYKKICWENLTSYEAEEVMLEKYTMQKYNYTLNTYKDILENAITMICMKYIRCGKSKYDEILDVMMLQSALTDNHPEELTQEILHLTMLYSIYFVVTGEPTNSNIRFIYMKIEELKKNVPELLNDERLFLKLISEGGKKICEAGIMVGWFPDISDEIIRCKKVYKKADNLKQKIMNALKKHEIYKDILSFINKK